MSSDSIMQAAFTIFTQINNFL